MQICLFALHFNRKRRLKTKISSTFLLQTNLSLVTLPLVPHVSFSPSVYHIYHSGFQVVIGLQVAVQPYPSLQPDVISVRQTRDLPLPSFRFVVTHNTLGLGYILSTTRVDQGLSPIFLLTILHLCSIINLRDVVLFF